MSLTVVDLSLERNDKTIFSDLNFHLEPGQILHVQGENGAGKTSLLQVLAGLMAPSFGNIKNQFSSINYIGHQLAIKAKLTVNEHLEFFKALQQKKTAINNQAILDYWQLSRLKNCYAENLSAGQKQRLALTRLFLSDTENDLWLLDEPMTALDQQGQRQLKKLMLEHAKNHGGVIFSSHQAVELDYSHKAIIKLC